MIYWCENCNVPLLTGECEICKNEGKYCSSDLKPVFRGEKKLYEEVTGIELPDNLFRNKNRVIYNAETLFTYTINNGDLIIDRNKKEIQKKIAGNKETFDETIKKTISANGKYLNEIERNAIGRIRKEAHKHNNKNIFILFSGGKDSAVVAYLVKEAFPDHTFPLVFADTNLEFEETIDYAENFAKKYGFKIIIPKPEKKFFDLVNELGPPSRYMRWCCTTQKAVPFAKFYKNKSNAITFDGIRRKESKTRIGYGIVRKNPKLIKQTNISPIIEWSEFDVWLYGQWKEIPQNPLYDYGFSRMGCWMCPNSSDISIFLTKRIHPELWKKWENTLLKYAREHNRDKTWVIENKWRNRKPFRNGDDDFSVREIQPCTSTNEIIYEYEFIEPINWDIIDFLKIFGKTKVSKKLNISSVKKNNTSIMVYANKNKITLTLKNNLFSHDTSLQTKKHLERQIIRYLNCVGCGACIGYCPNGAINIINNKFKIDNRKCTHCFKCVDTKYIKDICISYTHKINRNKVKRGKVKMSSWSARFKLNFNDKWRMIDLIENGITTKEGIAEKLGMGVPKIDFYSWWLRDSGLGLLELKGVGKGYEKTKLCDYILEIKKYNEQIAYELLFYTFCSNNNVFSSIVDFIYNNKEFGTEDVKEYLKRRLRELNGTEKNIDMVTNTFLNAISQKEGFGRLKLLEKPKKINEKWIAHTHVLNRMSLLYILSDHLERQKESYVIIKQLITESSAPGRIFRLDHNQMEQILFEMAMDKLITIEKTVGAQQVAVNEKYKDKYKVLQEIILRTQ